MKIVEIAIFTAGEKADLLFERPVDRALWKLVHDIALSEIGIRELRTPGMRDVANPRGYPRVKRLRGQSILVVEDDFLQARDISLLLEGRGAIVVGPVPSLEESLELAEETERLDGAVLDVRLADGNVFPLADKLAERRIPFVFVTGYDPKIIPVSHRRAPYIMKPIAPGAIVEALRAVNL